MTSAFPDIEAKLDALLDQQVTLTRRWLSVASAAAYSDLSGASIRRLLAAGKLTAFRPVKGRLVIDRLELDALISSSTGRLRTGRGHRLTTGANCSNHVR